MTEARYVCPDCGSIDLQIENKDLKDREGKSLATASCPNCAWAGPLRDTLGFVTTEQVWDIERVGEVLLRVLSRHAVGPMVQVFEFVGLIPKRRSIHGGGRSKDVRTHNARVDKIREYVLRTTMAATLEAAFQAAAEANQRWATETGQDPHPLLEEDEEVFGGDA